MNPFAAIAFAAGNKGRLHEAIIKKAAAFLMDGDYDSGLWKTALEELRSNNMIQQNPNQNNIRVGNSINTTFGKWIYCCIRVLKPQLVIETGVAHGSSF
jgi:hypothetical protein